MPAGCLHSIGIFQVQFQ